MAATKLNIGARAAPAVAVGLLLATSLLLAAATVSNASRPLKVSSSSEGGAQHTVESPPAVGYIIQTVVGTAEEQDGRAAGHSRLKNVDMLGGIKNQGPSPGDGH